MATLGLSDSIETITPVLWDSSRMEFIDIASDPFEDDTVSAVSSSLLFPHNTPYRPNMMDIAPAKLLHPRKFYQFIIKILISMEKEEMHIHINNIPVMQA